MGFMSILIDEAPLGKKQQYVTTYNQGLLFGIPRIDNRKELSLDLESLPFCGRDLWYGYELSWLNMKGKPEVRAVIFEFPFDTDNIIESKSCKLYLNSFNQTVFSSDDQVKELLVKDLSLFAGGNVSVALMSIMDIEKRGFHTVEGKCLDNLDIEVASYCYDPSLLKKTSGCIKEVMYCNLLKSNCPATGQPDWGTIVVEYDGEAIDHSSFLQYICSFRNHSEFHEQCVERIFTDLAKYYKFDLLTVYAQYLRRGGIDINPWRSSSGNKKPQRFRFIRQ